MITEDLYASPQPLLRTSQKTNEKKGHRRMVAPGRARIMGDSFGFSHAGIFFARGLFPLARSFAS